MWTTAPAAGLSPLLPEGAGRGQLCRDELLTCSPPRQEGSPADGRVSCHHAARATCSMPSTGLPGARGITEHIWGLGDPQKHAPPTQYDHPTERFLHVLRAEAVLPLPVPRHFLIVPSADHPISVALGHLPSRHPAPHSRVRGAAQSPSRPLVSCPRPPAEGGSTQGQAPCLLSQPGPPEPGLGAAAAWSAAGTSRPSFLPSCLHGHLYSVSRFGRVGGRGKGTRGCYSARGSIASFVSESIRENVSHVLRRTSNLQVLSLSWRSRGDFWHSSPLNEENHL